MRGRDQCRPKLGPLKNLSSVRDARSPVPRAKSGSDNTTLRQEPYRIKSSTCSAFGECALDTWILVPRRPVTWGKPQLFWIESLSTNLMIPYTTA
jgi:hypothetical protein